MRRVIDSKKRIQIGDLMEDVNLKPGDAVDISTDADSRAIIILPLPPRCVSCGEQDETKLVEFGSDPVRHICSECGDHIGEAREALEARASMKAVSSKPN